MHDENPYAAPQTIDTRTVLPPTPRVPENRDYRWLKRGLCSLALVLSPITILLVGRFEEFAVLVISLVLPFCCGMLAAVPPRTPGRACLIFGAVTQAIGSFCVFVIVLMPLQENYARRYQNLLTIAAAAEAVCYLCLTWGLIRLGRWLDDVWLRRLCYCSWAALGLLLSSIFWLRGLSSEWDRIGLSLAAIVLFGGASYLSFWAALWRGLRIPRLVAASIADPPRFEARDNA